MELKLLKSTQDILNNVSEITRKPFEFIHKPDMQMLAAVKIARKSMPSHIIYYKTTGAGILDHLIAHECGHIIRMWSVPVEDRKVPAANEENKRFALKQIEDDILRLSKVIPIDQLSQIFNIWFNGIIRQLTNIPVDMRIERWIHDKYPELRKPQVVSIDKQIREITQGLSKRVSDFTPKKIFNASNYINYSFALYMESIIGKKYTAPYKRTPYTDIGGRLVNLVIESEDQGYKQDMEIINQWTDIISLKGWYYWVDFEDLPSDYLQYQ